MLNVYIEEVVKRVLIEDMNHGDMTTDCLIQDESLAVAEIVSKENGIIAGLDVVECTFKELDINISFEKRVKDGQRVEKGDVLGVVKGKTRAILKGERTALNLLQRLSGIATKTYTYTQRVKDQDVSIVDTRKTTPGLRILEKYAVRMGGGRNHRFNLSDAVMIKDNHIKAVGSIKEAVEGAKAKVPHTAKIEVEVETLEQLKEALEAGADIIMLDNMDIGMMKRAVAISDGKVLLEASGNMTLDTILDVARTGVDIISSGALTHSVKALDISLNIMQMKA